MTDTKKTAADATVATDPRTAYALRRLEAENRRLEAILAGTNAGTWEWNIRTGETVFNARWADIIGETLDSLAPISIETWLSRVHPEDRKASKAALERHFRGETDFYECEARMRHRDGHWVWVLDRGRVSEWTDDGAPLRMAGTHIDVTERVRERDHLAERERFYRLTQKATGVGTWDWDLLDDRITWDTASLRLIGRSDDAKPLAFSDWLALVHPDDRDPTHAEVNRQVAEGGEFIADFRYRTADGGSVWVQGRGQVIHRTADGRPARMVGTHTSINESKEAQLQVAAFARRLSLLADHVPGMLYQYQMFPDGRSCFPFASDGISFIYGCTPAEVREDATPVFDVLHPDDIERVSGAITESARSLETWHGEYRVQHPDRGEIWVEGSASPQRLGDGSVLWHGYIADITARKRLREEAHAQERLYRTLFESVSDAVGLVTVERDGGFRYRMGNAALRLQAGLNDLEGHRPEDILPADVATRLNAEYGRCARECRPHAFETTVARPDAIRALETRLTPILDETGRVTAIAAISRDVSAARAAHEALAARERRLRTLFDAIPDPVLLIDPETGRGRRFNASAHRQMGYAPQDFARLSVRDYEVQGSGATRLADRLAAAMSTGGESLETRLRRADGTCFDVRVSARPVDLDGAEGLLCVFTDISDDKRLQMEVTAARDQLASYISLAPIGIYVADAEGRYISVNKAACDQSGFMRGELVGARIADYVWPEDAALAADHFATMRREGIAVGDVRLRRKGGGFFWGTVRAGMLPDGTAIAFVEEVTAQKQLHAELERSNAELERFAYVVSHDLRAPLRMINTYAQMLERLAGDQLDEKPRRFLSNVQRGAARMDEMLMALLTYSRVGRQGDPVAPVPVRDLVDEALRYLAPAVQETGARVTVAGRWPILTMSRNEGVRLFQNLVGNALKYSRPDVPPGVSVAVAAVPEGWRFTVTDNGIGIDPAHTDRLFKVFQRLHTDEEYEGTGIGLAVCRRIVERHGGRVWITSEGPGTGTTVGFILPDQSADEAPA